MLNVKELYSIVNSALSTNIEHVAICTTKGNIVTYAGNDSIQIDAVTSLFCKFWDETKKEIILLYDNGPIYITPISQSYYLFIVGSNKAHLGLIAQKATCIKQIIGDSLEAFVDHNVTV